MAGARLTYRLSFPGLAVAGLIFAALLVAEPVLWTPTLYTRLAAAAFVFGLPWLAMQWASSGGKSRETQLADEVRLMCSTDLQRVAIEGAAAWQGQIKTNHPVIAQIEAILIDHARTVDELEQARQGAD